MQFGTSFGNVQLEIAGLMRLFAGIEVPGGVGTPSRRQLLNDPSHWLRVLFAWTEVPGAGEVAGIAVQVLAKAQVTRQRLKHVLPRADRIRVAYVCGAPLRESR